jgi:hypothetical protein
MKDRVSRDGPFGDWACVTLPPPITKTLGAFFSAMSSDADCYSSGKRRIRDDKRVILEDDL